MGELTKVKCLSLGREKTVSLERYLAIRPSHVVNKNHVDDIVIVRQ